MIVRNPKFRQADGETLPTASTNGLPYDDAAIKIFTDNLLNKKIKLQTCQSDLNAAVTTLARQNCRWHPTVCRNWRQKIDSANICINITATEIKTASDLLENAKKANSDYLLQMQLISDQEHKKQIDDAKTESEIAKQEAITATANISKTSSNLIIYGGIGIAVIAIAALIYYFYKNRK